MVPYGEQAKRSEQNRPSSEAGQNSWSEQSQNALLGALSDEDRAVALKRGQIVDFTLRQAVYSPGAEIDAAYFPIDCVLSVVTHMLDGTMVEIGTIGREGTSAIPLLMGATTTANESFCQVQGRAWKMPAEDFTSLLETSKPFRGTMNRFLQGYVNMLGQIAACNRVHTIYERCCRWLLMTQDRVAGPQFPLTHEFLATMLGSQRSSVTLAAATLQRAGYIKYERGHITILDRAGLRDTACECYDVAREQFTEAFKAD